MTDDLESPGSIVAKLEQAIDACEGGNSARGKKHLAAFVIRYRDTILSRLTTADEIARLRAENERLREALRRIARSEYSPNIHSPWDEARTALQEGSRHD